MSDLTTTIVNVCAIAYLFGFVALGVPVWVCRNDPVELPLTYGVRKHFAELTFAIGALWAGVGFVATMFCETDEASSTWLAMGATGMLATVLMGGLVQRAVAYAFRAAMPKSESQQSVQ